MPLFIDDIGFDTSQTGLILLAPAIGAIATAPYIRKIMAKITARKLLFLNTILTAILYTIQVLVF